MPLLGGSYTSLDWLICSVLHAVTNKCLQLLTLSMLLQQQDSPQGQCLEAIVHSLRATIVRGSTALLQAHTGC